MKHLNNEVIYQIYPLTFNYASGSKSDPYKGAYGNLKGITALAPYVASLGVDTIWITPFYPWGGNGFGYDITDYTGIDPMYGNAEDLQELCKTFHNLGLRVLIDQVYNHCSMHHPWFQKSLKKEAPYTDYFIWADAKGYDENNEPIAPNNWPSTWSSDGDSVWRWSKKRRQFYMHSFDYTMPNLNLNNTVVQDELLKVAKYWFDLGIDGFRLDATTHYACDPLLRDNPLDENGRQKRIYDITTQGGADFINRLKQLCNSYATPKTLLAEYWFDKSPESLDKNRKLIKNSGCDAFFLDALNYKLSDFVKNVSTALSVIPKGEKINWAFSNHDLERAATRLFGNHYTPQKMVMLMQLLTALPGSICLFQGDELGLPNPVWFENCKKPEFDPLNVWTPFSMPWDAARAGFAMSNTEDDPTRKMALQPDSRQYDLAVSTQNKPGSTLNRVRKAIARRRNSIFNEYGNIYFLNRKKPAEFIAFVRTNADESRKVLCLYNFSDRYVKLTYKKRTYKLAPEKMLIKEL